MLQQVVYSFPENLNERSLEPLLGVIISLYTFTTLSLSDKKLDFMCWSQSKVAIRTVRLSDETLLFLFLRAPAVYSDSSVNRALDHIRRGLFFVLGETGLSSIPPIRAYLEAQGPRICRSVLPLDSPDPLPFSFTNLPSTEWDRSAEIAALTELSLVHHYPVVWGIVCFLNDLLLVSHSPLEIIRLFTFVPPENKRSTVFLSRDDRTQLTDYAGCVAQIPDLDVIPADLATFAHEAPSGDARRPSNVVLFSLLLDPSIDAETFAKIHEALNRAMIDIIAGIHESTEPEPPRNVIVYNRVLHMLKCGIATPEFQSNAIYAHDSFMRDDNLKELIMHNAREFSVCMNILSIEHLAAVPGIGKPLEELYDDALTLNPELPRYLRSLHIAPPGGSE
jgi:hypothetical protein